MIKSSPRKVSIIMSVLRLIKALLGMAVLFLSVKYFGVSFERDSWVISITIYTVLIYTVFGPINDIFRTKFIHIRNEFGEREAVESVNSLVSLQWIIIGVAILGLALFVKPVTALFAPSFNPAEREFLSVMILTLIPFLALTQFATMLTGLLNTYESYFVPDLLAISASVINILFIVLFSPALGIYSLVVATILNNILLVTILITMAYRLVPSFNMFSRLNLRKSMVFVAFSLPVYIATFAMQAYQTVEKIVTNTYGIGNVSLFDYARKIMDIPSLVFSSVIPIVLTPLLANHFSKTEPEIFSFELRRFLRMILLFTIPISVVVIICRGEISTILFGVRNHDFEMILIYLGTAINLIVLSIIGGQALIAQKRVKMYVVANVVGSGISTVLSLVLYRYVGIPFIAMFFLIGQVVLAVILIFSIDMLHKAKLVKDIAKFSGVFWVVLFGGHLVNTLVGFSSENIYECLAFTIFIGICAIVFTAGSMFIFHIEERSVFLKHS